MKTITSVVIPLPRKDIDTDLILPANFLHTTTKEGLGQYVFDRLRKLEPNFPFNQKKYQKAQILVTRENFGCGSSREHAAWALADWGIRVIIAPSFADIFHSNAIKNQILPIILDTTVIEKIIRAEKKESPLTMTVDLPAQTVTLLSGAQYAFPIKPYIKTCLMEEIDDFDYLLKNRSAIAAFKKKQAKNCFFTIAHL